MHPYSISNVSVTLVFSSLSQWNQITIDDSGHTVQKKEKSKKIKTQITQNINFAIQNLRINTATTNTRDCSNCSTENGFSKDVVFALYLNQPCNYQ
jgi:hypothetical protein